MTQFLAGMLAGSIVAAVLVIVMACLCINKNK